MWNAWRTSGDCALLPCLAIMVGRKGWKGTGDVTVLLLPLNQVPFSDASGTGRIGTVNPNLKAVANGASAGLILDPDPHFGVLRAQTLPIVTATVAFGNCKQRHNHKGGCRSRQE